MWRHLFLSGQLEAAESKNKSSYGTLDFPWTDMSKVAASCIMSLTVAAVQINVWSLAS